MVLMEDERGYWLTCLSSDVGFICNMYQIRQKEPTEEEKRYIGLYLEYFEKVKKGQEYAETWKTEGLQFSLDYLNNLHKYNILKGILKSMNLEVKPTLFNLETILNKILLKETVEIKSLESAANIFLTIARKARSINRPHPDSSHSLLGEEND